MLRKTAHFILYLSTLQKPAAGAGFCNLLKYKADTFYFSTIQKPAPDHCKYMCGCHCKKYVINSLNKGDKGEHN